MSGKNESEEISLISDYVVEKKEEKKETIKRLALSEEQALEPPQLLCPESSKISTAGKPVYFDVVMRNVNAKKIDAHLKINLVYSNPPESGGPEWPIYLGLEEEHSVQKNNEFDIAIDGGQDRQIKIRVHTPKGVSFGDMIDIVMIVHPVGMPLRSNSLTLRVMAKQSIFAIKTTIGQEKEVADMLASRASTSKAGVFSVLCPYNLRGYILVEAMSVDRLRELVRSIRRAKGVVEGDTSLAEVEHYLTPKPAVAEINEGDIVELVSGPFKGEKARVMRINEDKEEITVELFEAMVPIPVTVRADSVKVIEREEK